MWEKNSVNHLEYCSTWKRTEREQVGTASKVRKYSEKRYYPVKEIVSKEPVEVFQERVIKLHSGKKKTPSKLGDEGERRKEKKRIIRGKESSIISFG